MRLRGAVGLLLALAAAALALPAAAQPVREQIADYLVRLEVHEDNAVTVTEDITVDALGREIRRGIYRDIPLGGLGLLGIGGSAFELTSATRDGAPETARVESTLEGVRVYLGRADTFLAPGTYRYRIAYRMSDAVRHFDGYDELYWNATGNAWAFDIARARVLVVPPGGAPVTGTAVYTGGFGERGEEATIGEDAQGRPVFTTTRPLRAGEGVTVAVAWPKGYVAPPSLAQRLAGWLERFGVYGAGVVTIALLSAYYAFAWLRVGRDPPGGAVIPVYHPRLPPAAMRYIERMGFDDSCLSAALVSLATKGRLRIEDEDGTTRLVRVHDDPTVAKPVSDGEQALLSALFAHDDVVEIEKAERTRLRAAKAALKHHFDRTFDRVYFNRNLLWFAGGAAITLFGAALVLLLSPASIPLVIAAAAPAVVVAVFATMLLSLGRKARAAAAGGRYFQLLGLLLPVAFVAFAFSSFWEIGGVLLYEVLSYGLVPILVIGLILGLNVAFFFLLRAPTAIGREALDEIEGTRLYLTVAEEDRLKFHHPPDRTPEHFHELLPYAMALGVETAWTDQFRAEIAAAQADPGHDPYLRPSWYRGRGNAGFSGTRDVGRLGASMSSAIAAATVSQSSSGSGGGGFSGGGGGGGGGGGW